MTNAHELVKRIKALAREMGKTPSRAECIHAGIISDWEMRKHSYEELLRMAGLNSHLNSTKKEINLPKILILDIETAPILAYVWGLFDQNVGLNQIKTDWHILSWAAKWAGSKEVFYHDQRHSKSLENDKKILQELWKLMDEADIICGQNSQKFDRKKINARFLHHGMQPPSPYRQIDTMLLAKKHFGFTSNKLAYMSEKFCTTYKKLDHGKFSGFELWKECMAGNMKAWREMEKYNRNDILATEELMRRLIPWDNGVNFNVYHDSFNNQCFCGSREFKDGKFVHTNAGRYAVMTCKKCGKAHTVKENLLSKEKRKALVK